MLSERVQRLLQRPSVLDQHSAPACVTLAESRTVRALRATIAQQTVAIQSQQQTIESLRAQLATKTEALALQQQLLDILKGRLS